VTLSGGENAVLTWVPQESIFFECSALARTFVVDLAESATFIAVEPMVFGRREMGEHVKLVSVVDRWTVRQAGKLVHAEAFKLGPVWPKSRATFAGNHAIATLLLVSPQADKLVDRVRAVLGPDDGASAWNGKLVARLMAKDGFRLRKTLIQVLSACLGREKLPMSWAS
jgi:urease accessory protein